MHTYFSRNNVVSVSRELLDKQKAEKTGQGVLTLYGLCPIIAIDMGYMGG